MLEPGVKAIVSDGRCYLESSKGKLDYKIDSGLECTVADNKIALKLMSTDKHAKAMWGTTRALLANAAQGLHKPWSKTLELKGIGYKVALSDKTLTLSIGFTPFKHVVPSDIDISCPNQTQIALSSINRERVGQAAAEIRSYKKPDAYQGYGIRYLGEVVKTKTAAKK